MLCFDQSTGTLVSVEFPKLEHLNPPDISRIEYAAFHSIGDKSVPFEIRAFKNKKLIASIKILEITNTTENDPSLFSVPANAEFWAQCDEPQKAELLTRVSPSYPASARRRHEEGRVGFYAVIGTDGSLSHLTIIQPNSPELEAAAAEAIRQWRYKPAVCGSTPMRVQASIYTDFQLQ